MHQLTLRPSTLISLIDHFNILNGWMDGQPGGPTQGSRIFVRGRGSRPDGQNTEYARGTNTYARTHAHTHTYIHTAVTDRHMNVHAQADG